MEQRPFTRERHAMPDDVRDALDSASLQAAYDARPPYQRNDYLGWIGRAKRPATREKRIRQMLEELGQGGVYMKMKHVSSSAQRSDPDNPSHLPGPR